MNDEVCRAVSSSKEEVPSDEVSSLLAVWSTDPAPDGALQEVRRAAKAQVTPGTACPLAQSVRSRRRRARDWLAMGVIIVLGDNVSRAGVCPGEFPGPMSG